MGLETATYISGLDSSNPPSGDKKKQGDDHLRLIKSTIKATLPNADRAQYFRRSTTKTANFTIVAADMEKLFIIETTAGTVTATLPTLAAGDDGWCCHFMKSNGGTNPLFIVPASGTFQSGEVTNLSKVRRCIPGVRTSAFWTGTAWILTRASNVPIGTLLPFDGTTLPTGYEWPNGQTLASAATNYPEYNAVKGSGLTVDVRSRAIFGGPMGGADPGRLAGTDLNGGTHGDLGGFSTQLITRSYLPDYELPDTLSISGSVTPNATIYISDSFPNISTGTGASFNNMQRANNLTQATWTLSANVNGSVTLGGSGGSFPMIPPAIVLNEILVVE